MILETILASLGDGEVKTVCIGLNWTAVVVIGPAGRQCGLAATLSKGHDHGNSPQIPEAGSLAQFSAHQLAGYALDNSSALTSVGMAAINALLPRNASYSSKANAEQLILERGNGKRVVLVGHFPFVPRLREHLLDFDVLDLEPQPGDLPASMAPEILPTADVVGITAMSMINGSLEGILELCPPTANVLLLGPSAPLTPILFDFGIDVISGALVESEEQTLLTIMQGGNFRQVHSAGVQLVNLFK